MWRFWQGLFVLIGLCVPAIAQQAVYVYTPLGFQQITPVPTGTFLTIPTVAGGASARMVVICVETNMVRYRDDGVAPTSSVGMPIEPAATTNPGCITYSGSLSAIQFIQATSPATLDVSYYR